VEAGFPKSLPSGARPKGSCSNKPKRDCRFPRISRALDASVPLGKADGAAWTRQYHRLADPAGRAAGNKKPGPSAPGFFELQVLPIRRQA
jgi:hypothetical protein